MKSPMIAAGLGGALMLSATCAFAADHEAGVPLAPAEAAGTWTLESGGHSLCRLTLSPDKAAGGYGVQVPATCGDVLPTTPAAWAPTHDGMQFVGADGQALLAFNRWSNSLFVSHRISGVDIQLRRGGPMPTPAP
jgi:hypothetical protein